MSTPESDLTLHFVRHGETVWNAERRFQTPEVPLSERGRAQAAAVAETLADSTHARVLLASDYERALETARIISERVGLPVVEERELRERNFGVARGQLYADIGETTINLWREPHYRIEGGESWADVFDRVRPYLDQLIASPPARELILVTHGGTMSVALTCLAGGTVDAFKITPLENCALRTVVVPAGSHTTMSQREPA